ncbi:ABC transporter permease [Actinoplanes couchii]|uniref:ABC transporter permease n=1 Tax=Actinoplanes couchii TaxID=403638 RepID=A0ABQ3XMD7_9ACTN|nr:ABC transporter permease [Actinoplanes couchii]MDR6321534.1 putative ABC transport system permease protein [Actinoplanes couchii]GID59630.1 ABC transporter permease [Actinoplanes couchii]
MIRLAWSTVRARRSGFVAAFLAVLCGSAVLTACGILLESSVRSVVPPDRYRAADLVIGAPQTLPLADDVDPRFPERATLPASLAADVARLPGVRAAIGDVSVPVTVLESGAALSGHGWASTALGGYALVSGAAPAGPDEVALGPGMAGRLGGTVRLVTGTTVADYRVTGIVDRPAVFFTDDRARELTGRPDRVDTIGVLADGPVDVAGPGLVVYSGDERGTAERLDVGTARAFLGELALAFGGSMLLVILIVVASTVALSVRRRLPEFTVLRAVGATPRQVLRMILAETAVVGALGAVLGVLPGIGLSLLLTAGFVRAGALPDGFGLRVSLSPVPAAMGLCLLSALLGGWIAARGAARRRPAEPERRPGRARMIAGLLLVPAGLVMAFAGSAEGAAFSAFVLLFAVLLLGPWLVGGVVAVLGRWVNRRSEVGGFLAAANARAESRRLAAATIPLVIGVILAAGQLFSGTTTAAAARQQATDGLLAGHVVTSTTAGLSPDVADLVRAVPGAGAVTPVVRSRVTAIFTDDGSPQIVHYPALGADLVPETLDLGVTDGDIAGLRTGTVALSRAAADTLSAGLGDPVTLRLGDGTPITPVVVAVYERGLGFGDVVLPHAVVLDHVTDRLDDALLVAGAGSPRSAVAHLPTVRIGSTWPDVAGDGGDAGAGVLLNAVLLGYLAIAVGNTLVTATVARVPEFTLLRQVGATRAQVLAMMRGEARIVVVTAVAVGAVAVTPALIGTGLALTGSPVPVVPPPLALGIVAAAALLGRAAVMTPARILTGRR